MDYLILKMEKRGTNKRAFEPTDNQILGNNVKRFKRSYEASQATPLRPELVNVPNNVAPAQADTDFFGSGIVGELSGPSQRDEQNLQQNVASSIDSAGKVIDLQLTYLYGQLNSPNSTPEQRKIYSDRIDELKALQVKLDNAKATSTTADFATNEKILNDIRPELQETLRRDWTQNVALSENVMFGDAVQRYVFLKSIFAPDTNFNSDPGMQMLYTIVSGDRRGKYDFAKLPYLMNTQEASEQKLNASFWREGTFKWNDRSEAEKKAYYDYITGQRTRGNQEEESRAIAETFNALSQIVTKPVELWTLEDQKLFTAFQDAYVVENDYKQYLVTRDDAQWNEWDAKLFKEQIDRKGNGYYDPTVVEKALSWTLAGTGLIFGALTPWMPIAPALLGSLAFGVGGMVLPPVGGPEWLHTLYLGLSLGISGVQLIGSTYNIAKAIQAQRLASAAASSTINLADDAARIAGTSAPVIQDLGNVGTTTGISSTLAGSLESINEIFVDAVENFDDVFTGTLQTFEQGAPLVPRSALDSSIATTTNQGLFSRLSSNVSQTASRTFSQASNLTQQLANASSELALKVADGVSDFVENSLASIGTNFDVLDEATDLTPLLAAAAGDENVTVSTLRAGARGYRDVGVARLGIDPASRLGRGINYLTDGIINRTLSTETIQRVTGYMRNQARSIQSAFTRELTYGLINAAEDYGNASRHIATAVETAVTAAPNVSVFARPLSNQVKAVLDGSAINVKIFAKESVNALVDLVKANPSVVTTKLAQYARSNMGKIGMLAGETALTSYRTATKLSKEEQSRFETRLLDLVDTIDKLGSTLGYSISEAVKDTIFEELAAQLLQAGRTDRFKSQVELDTFRQAANVSYDQEPPEQIGSFHLEYNSDTVKAWVDETSKRVLLSFRGTNLKKSKDINANFAIAVNALSKSERYLHDKMQVDALLQKFDPLEYSFYLTGHSLGGAIVTQMKRDYPFFKEGVTFNGANQPIDLLMQQSDTVKRMYTSSDPLYNYGGGKLTKASVLASSSTDLNQPIKDNKALKALYTMYKGHQLTNFSDGRGSVGYNY